MVTRVVLTLMVGLALVAFGAMAVGAEQEAPAGGGHISPLPTTWQEIGSDLAIWTAVVFLVLLLVLWKFAWRPIAAGLARRERRIADEITSAERRNVEARQLLEQYHQKLAASGAEIQEILAAARRDAEKTGDKIVEKARADAQAQHQRMLGEIELATANALKELAEQSATLAVELAGKIVQSRLDPTVHSRLIERAMADFSEQQSGEDSPTDGRTDGPGS